MNHGEHGVRGEKARISLPQTVWPSGATTRLHDRLIPAVLAVVHCVFHEREGAL